MLPIIHVATYVTYWARPLPDASRQVTTTSHFLMKLYLTSPPSYCAMSMLKSTCPRCHSTVLSNGTDCSITELFAWSTPVVCSLCEHTWLICCRDRCDILQHKNVFYTRRNLRDHARYWHKPSSSLVDVNHRLTGGAAIDPALHMDIAAFPEDYTEHGTGSMLDDDDHNSVCASMAEATNSNQFEFSSLTTTQFANRCISGSMYKAIVCLVQQSLLQEDVSVDLPSTQNLPTYAVQLFLYIAKLLDATGQKEHASLSAILELLLKQLPPSLKPWATMPSTIAGFQSHILNPTNKHSLVSLLPMPKTVLLYDDSHAYTCLQEIVAFVLVLQNSEGPLVVPLRLQLLCQSLNLHTRQSSATSLVSIGLLFWMDGWDPSQSSKSNRSPVHTATATLLCIDNKTGIPFDVRTYPIACGPGKADHNAVFEALKTSLEILEDENKLMWSHYHHQWTTVKCHIITFLMDQPERRSSNCLLGGNSKQHGMFGLSCNFEQLQRTFSACAKCLRAATRYLNAGTFTHPVIYSCRQCYAFSLSQLLKEGEYKSVLHADELHDAPLPHSTPGLRLAMKPGMLNFEILPAGWNHAIRKFVYDKTWSKNRIKAYFNLLCLNEATVANFLLRCGNYLLLESISNNPDNFPANVVIDIVVQHSAHPELFDLPAPPCAWSIGSINHRVETIMHMAMNTQKAVFKLLLQWCANLDHGQTLLSRLQPLVHSVQGLRLPFVPVRMFKNDKFGGYVAENYRALAHLAPWLCRCLLEEKFAPPIVVLPLVDKPRLQWTVKENKGWLRSRNIKIPPKLKAKELTKLVETYHACPAGPPPIRPDTNPTATEMRRLIYLLFKVFGTLFATDLPGQLAGNRFEVLVVEFLDCIEKIGRGCHPDKKKPIWISKYGILGLLRCRQHFMDYIYIHSLYEGGIEGEGMVKELRPLCPNAVKSRWALNLMNAYNRQNILTSLATRLTDTPEPTVPHSYTRKPYPS